MDLNQIGRIVLIIGIGTVLFGGLLLLISRFPVFRNLGQLPGDIRIEAQGFTCIFPIVTMILLSVGLTIIINIIIRLINRP